MTRTRQHTVTWWRWRAHVRSALHMFADPAFHRAGWLAGDPAYGTVTDAVYRLVGDTWLDRWSASAYVGSVFVDAREAAAVDAAVAEILGLLHEVGEDAPAPAYLGHPRWPAVTAAAHAAHVLLAAADGDDPARAPETLEILRIRCGGR